MNDQQHPLHPLASEEVTALLEKYERLIPAENPDAFPEDFSLSPLDWAMSEEEIGTGTIEAIVKGSKQRIRPIRTMDVEFLPNSTVEKARKGEIDLVQNYPCGLKCPGCFSQEDVYGDRANLMTWQEVMKVIDDAKRIGLRSVKFLGPGELLQNPDLFDILGALDERGIPISIFTKGAELGDDTLARQIYGAQGIRSAKQLTEQLAKYEGVRLLLGFNSFSSERQDWMVGSLRKPGDYIIRDGTFESRGVSNYTAKRDNALVNIVNAGFNKGEQRLSLIAAPVFYHQRDEMPGMYLWAARRNIPLIIAPTMESGPKAQGLQRANEKLDPEHEKLVDLMTQVYGVALDKGITTMDRIREEGVSAYMGTAPCSQVANGLFMRLNGQIQLCPGRSDPSAVYGNVHDTPLADTWVESPNYAMGSLSNNWCAAKTQGMPKRVQEEVLKRLEQR
ncbi:MAG: radical SAM protein, partial [Candidatus Woesearchaeota archaeon]